MFPASSLVASQINVGSANWVTVTAGEGLIGDVAMSFSLHRGGF